VKTVIESCRCNLNSVRHSNTSMLCFAASLNNVLLKKLLLQNMQMVPLIIHKINTLQFTHFEIHDFNQQIIFPSLHPYYDKTGYIPAV
jgi:hypothetical protein